MVLTGRMWALLVLGSWAFEGGQCGSLRNTKMSSKQKGRVAVVLFIFFCPLGRSPHSTPTQYKQVTHTSPAQLPVRPPLARFHILRLDKPGTCQAPSMPLFSLLCHPFFLVAHQVEPRPLKVPHTEKLPTASPVMYTSKLLRFLGKGWRWFSPTCATR